MQTYNCLKQFQVNSPIGCLNKHNNLLWLGCLDFVVSFNPKVFPLSFFPPYLLSYPLFLPYPLSFPIPSPIPSSFFSSFPIPSYPLSFPIPSPLLFLPSLPPSFFRSPYHELNARKLLHIDDGTSKHY